MSATVRFEPFDQSVVFQGALHPRTRADFAPARETLQQAADAVRGTLSLDLKKLTAMNHVALVELARFAAEAPPALRLRVVITSVLSWQAPRLRPLAQLFERVSVETYDDAFYPGQSVLETDDFIPILRTQTKVTWAHERELIQQHGLREGMEIADICCGSGDFAVLLHKHFAPTRVVGVDHSKPNLAQARRMAADFGVTRGLEFHYGDAAALLLEDDSFDFVICRHSLQIFNEPASILRELVRICRPGGRIYVTNEKNSHIFGEPRGETIAWTYQEVARLFAWFDMDVDLGPKSFNLLKDAGLSEVRIQQFLVSTDETDREEFAAVIRAWEHVYAGQMSSDRGDDEAYNARLRQGFRDHVAAIEHPDGYAGWPIWIASGTKPRRK